MDSVESIECRIYMAENDMYLAASNLAADLHGLERAITELQGRVHTMVCESGRQPVASQARRVVADVTTTVEQLDLRAIRRRSRELEAMLVRLDQLEDDRKAACRPRPVVAAA